MRIRLFERLSGNTNNTDELSDSERMSLSIKNHVIQLLETHQGSALTVPDLGLPDINALHLSPHDAIHNVRREVERVVRTYEPRMSNTSVRYLGDINCPLHLSFSITGDIIVHGRQEKITFNTGVNNRGYRAA
ncbi:MAG: type VI secretion system baseplate subunit TssE [Aliivibrio sp.]|uniref:type VI secretion system baseplate subunit TssE n=1 Tax=Aliivibrio sp. TaxID=1872443 RepID=UPI001A551396|nr:type VI secretion system baseplate subunit TssE [Aliivibrio sp.]